MILWQRNTVRSHIPGEGGLLGLSGGASMICIGFGYYFNVTHSSTLRNCWFARDLWFVSNHSKHRSSPSPTTAPLCKVQYRDPCSCPSSGLVVSPSQYFQFILCGKKSKDEDFCLSAAVAWEVMVTSWPGGQKEFLGEGFPHLAVSSKVGTQFTALVSGAELVIQERILLS